MRDLTTQEVMAVAGAYGDNGIQNIIEAVVCSVGGAVVGAWTLAIAGGSSAFKGDLVGIGGGLTALVGMFGGAAIGAVAGAVIGPFYGYNNGLDFAAGLLQDLMRGELGSSKA
jgi:hypothetical protein